MRRQYRFAAIVGLCLLVPAPAWANGAMSLALATFAWGPWLGYVIATILYEAWAFGQILALPWKQALMRSLAANAVTAGVGGCVSGVLAYPLLGIFGTTLNPNPLAQTLLLFAAFGLVSAWIETGVWLELAAPAGLSSRRLFARSCLVHVTGVPLALAILLLPSRPYPGLEGQAYSQRFFWLGRQEVRRALEESIVQHQRVPAVESYGELLETLRPKLGRFAGERDLWTAAYAPHYQRFDTGEARRGAPVEWNVRPAGFARILRGELPGPIWLTRVRANGWTEGLVLETGGRVRATSDPVALGYTASELKAPSDALTRERTEQSGVKAVPGSTRVPHASSKTGMARKDRRGAAGGAPVEGPMAPPLLRRGERVRLRLRHHLAPFGLPGKRPHPKFSYLGAEPV
jgi:hypothetical protein